MVHSCEFLNPLVGGDPFHLLVRVTFSLTIPRRAPAEGHALDLCVSTTYPNNCMFFADFGLFTHSFRTISFLKLAGAWKGAIWSLGYLKSLHKDILCKHILVRQQSPLMKLEKRHTSGAPVVIT